MGSMGSFITGATFPLWGYLLSRCFVMFSNFKLTANEMKLEGLKWSGYFLILGATYWVGNVAQNYGFSVVSECFPTAGVGVCRHVAPRSRLASLSTDCALIQKMSVDLLKNVLNLVLANDVCVIQAHFIKLMAMAGADNHRAADGISMMFFAMVSSFGLGTAAQALGGMEKAKQAAANVFAIVDRMPTIECITNDGVKPTQVVGRIEFQSVEFGDSLMYKDYNLVIEAGTTASISLLGALREAIVSKVLYCRC
ncbi:hypothetical protein H257_11522 [Aphanomyces astaci]|uniref:ABC transmembrane type-1 domain-containing protein n=1 Tax=Aphanomyces astaci TaxID=112090 RepID=W4G2B3_APHAT|nr:hypothetical protein H257_11522 [Aphanomyces astaci]ETV73862.1 hypothetical protein H257_11522 [Aphanomyces astaci]|eukprot:XP_009836798.1 hypothetical protein H257_11522 [Aphanomyces astaci]